MPPGTASRGRLRIGFPLSKRGTEGEDDSAARHIMSKRLIEHSGGQHYHSPLYVRSWKCETAEQKQR